jgi:hypothetical protein
VPAIFAPRARIVSTAYRARNDSRVAGQHLGKSNNEIQTAPEESYGVKKSHEGLDGQEQDTVVEPGEHVALSQVSDRSSNRIAARARDASYPGVSNHYYGETTP